MNIGLQATDWLSLSPYLILIFATLILLLIESFVSPTLKKQILFIVALSALVLAFLTEVFAPVSTHAFLTPWIRFDALTRFLTLLFLGIGICATLLSIPFFYHFEMQAGEYLFLLLSAVFGLILMGAAADFLTLFIGLETLSISLYILCGYMKKWKISQEASAKYFLMGALATAFFLYGVALLYGAVGTTQFAPLQSAYQTLKAEKVLFLSGIALITLGLAFKAAIVPFHLWAPDVYEGAATPLTAFMAVGTKAGAFAALAVIFLLFIPQFNPIWHQAIAIFTYPTLIYANFVALQQRQMRRFFAYSSISHAGFMLIPLAVGTPEALSALLFYLVVYAFATLGAFGVLAYLDQTAEGVMINDLRGLFQTSPILAMILAVCLLTLGGIPPTVGFIAKFYIFKLAFQAGYMALVIVALLTTILSAYYYLRIVALMFKEKVFEEPVAVPHVWTAGIVAVVSLVAIVLLSVYPQPLIEWTAWAKGG